MASYNKVILVGNLTRNPELRYTPSGSAVCDLGLAMNRKYSSGGQDREETCFVDVVVWNKQAENCDRFLEKGAPVLIEGRLQLDQWQDKESGANRSKLRVVAQTVQFLGSQGGDSGGGDYSQQPRQQQYQQQGQQQYQQQPRQQQQYSSPAPPQQQQQQYQQQPPPPMPEAFDPGDEAEDDIPF
jgi:single-strand DNA-binding protein